MSFLLSPLGRALAGSAVLVGTFFTWLFFHDARVEKQAADRVITKIEKKADANAEIASEVRTNVGAGKRGKPDPHIRRMQ